MSSYNGEKYIKKQIGSILNQEGVDVSILIRDDGSSDSTPEILYRLAENDKRVKCLFENNIGVKKSFLKLVNLADTEVDYYAFSDQDDIWLRDKLSAAVQLLSQEDGEYPLIYGSAVSLFANGKVIGEQFNCSSLHFGNFLIKNYYPGCTMVFNKKLKELICLTDYKKLNPFPLHDHWLNLVCTVCGGKVIMDRTSHILYRQHNGNVVGDRGIIEKIKGNGLLTHSDNTRWKIGQELHSLYCNYETIETKELLQIVLNYRLNIRNRLNLAINNKIKPISFFENITIFLIVLLGKF